MFYTDSLYAHTCIYSVYSQRNEINIYINVTLTSLKFQFKKIDSMLLTPDLFSTQTAPAIV